MAVAALTLGAAHLGHRHAAPADARSVRLRFLPPDDVLETLDFVAISPDGQRFLVCTMVGYAGATSTRVVLNWTADLKR
jgi:hypothetical protein